MVLCISTFVESNFKHVHIEGITLYLKRVGPIALVSTRMVHILLEGTGQKIPWTKAQLPFLCKVDKLPHTTSPGWIIIPH